MIRIDDQTALVTHNGTSTVHHIPTRGEVLDKHGLHGVVGLADVLHGWAVQ